MGTLSPLVLGVEGWDTPNRTRPHHLPTSPTCSLSWGSPPTAPGTPQRSGEACGEGSQGPGGQFQVAYGCCGQQRVWDGRGRAGLPGGGRHLVMGVSLLPVALPEPASVLLSFRVWVRRKSHPGAPRDVSSQLSGMRVARVLQASWRAGGLGRGRQPPAHPGSPWGEGAPRRGLGQHLGAQTFPGSACQG